jgi:hypothetical protein
MPAVVGAGAGAGAGTGAGAGLGVGVVGVVDPQFADKSDTVTNAATATRWRIRGGIVSSEVICRVFERR